MNQQSTGPVIGGLRDTPITDAGNHPYGGKLTLTDVQWTENKNEVLLTATVTARQILDASDSGLIWTDQHVQRGVKPEAPAGTPHELSLADGYPSSSKYVFNQENADDMAEKLLQGTARHLNPLIWNLRPGKFDGYLDPTDRRLIIYSGKIYLPDSHHRHQAILKASRIYLDAAGSEYPDYSLERQFKVELYFMSSEEEGDFFFDKNQRPRPTARAKAYDLTTEDVLANIAKGAIRISPSLMGNVNRVTDRLTTKNPDVMTLSTLRGFVEAGMPDDPTESETEELAGLVSQFYEMLVGVRSELGQLDETDRRKVRTTSMVDKAVVIHGLGALMRYYISDMKSGDQSRQVRWPELLSHLSDDVDYQHHDFSGDFFDRGNPLWREIGVIQVNKKGGEVVSNTRQTRRSVADELLELLGFE